MGKGIRHFIFYITMFAVSLLMAFLLVEMLVRIVFPQNLSGSWTEITDWGYYVNKANAQTQHQFKQRVVEYRFNDSHIRGSSLQSDIPKVLVLGDSYTFGFLIDEQYTFVQRLQFFADSSFGKRQVQFLNGGVTGWSTATYLAFWEQFGNTIAPEAVVVFFNTDDIGRSIKNQLYLLVDPQRFELELDTKQLKVEKYKQFFNNLPFYQWFLEHSHLVQFFRVRFMIYFQRKHGDSRFIDMVVPASPDLATDPSWAQAYGRALFRRMKKLCDSRNVKLFVITTGFHFMHHDSGKEVDPTAAFMQEAKNIFKQEGILFKDISLEMQSAIGNNIEAFVIADDGHPNEAAHKLIAQNAWAWLGTKLHAVIQ